VRGWSYEELVRMKLHSVKWEYKKRAEAKGNGLRLAFKDDKEAPR
jgi:hypothetical protein